MVQVKKKHRGEILVKFSKVTDPLGHIHIWQVSPQLSCGDTCQPWTCYLSNKPRVNEYERNEEIIEQRKLVVTLHQIFKQTPENTHLSINITTCSTPDVYGLLRLVLLWMYYQFSWIYAMMTSSNGNFPRYWPFVRGIHRSPVNSPHKGQWRGALMFSLICALINGRVNNREAGDLRRHTIPIMTSL